MFVTSSFLISGSNKLKGETYIQGSKNSVLPILAATILCNDECIIHSCPHLSDVDVSIKILNHLGAKTKRENDTLIVNAKDIIKNDIPERLMREMRSSIIFLGALLSRVKKATVSLPGGCELGPRPIDLHLNSLKQMGIKINENHGMISCESSDGLKGAQISLSFPSVGATENILLASVLSQGRTVITNAAREPEICDLANFLNSCGAKIYGAGEGSIIVDGVGKLNGAEHKVIPDRISAVTFMACGAITNGDITLHNVMVEHITSTLTLFEEAGCKVYKHGTSIRIKSPEKLSPLEIVRTMPYPGFPTDAQALLMSMSTIARGTSIFIENIFESRYKHVGELIRLGANIKVEGKVAIVDGVKKLSGALVEGKDLRGTAALIVAALGAEGETEITGLHHIDRGYEKLEDSLEKLGARIKRS